MNGRVIKAAPKDGSSVRVDEDDAVLDAIVRAVADGSVVVSESPVHRAIVSGMLKALEKGAQG